MSENHSFYNCNFILSQCNSMPLCIGIDGMGGSGKSTFSEQLAQAFQKQHIPVSVFHLDDFIHPRSVRYDTRFSEWENYYYRQWRYD
ncbi:MAG: P-loop NTPase fold protein, partial [Ruminococcus sp.]|nr:P-loop NTPase fold protein [Ruminococcus sp.]